LAPEQSHSVGLADGEAPRFEAYFATFSVCSHKVRAVLAEKGIPYRAHVMKLFARADTLPDNYHPTYVRMRILGAPNAKLVSGYTGQSSVTSEGFDPCVVPTLVDHLHQRVVVDSAVICDYLDQEGGGDLLVPAGMADAMSRQIALIDQAPHVAVLYGNNPHGDTRPESIAKPIEGVHDRKVTFLETAKSMVPDEPALIAAYEAKIQKEVSAKGFVYDEASMVDAHRRMGAHVAALEAQLTTHGGPWAMGDVYTMSDIMWSVSLFRMKWLGLGHHWETSGANPRVADYVERAFVRPSFQQAVIDYPMSTPPSQHIEPTAPYAQHLHKAWAEMRPPA
ncbi:MAG: glutathione S-transferase family protein, partial [Pseudomonadota bacterium]